MAGPYYAGRPIAGAKVKDDDLSRVPEELAADGGRQEALLREYGEVANNFRMLTDIRFKLLAFLPIAAAAAAAVTQESTGAVALGLSLFGLVVTIGLVTYNTRNDQLYEELVGRAAAIERSLGIPEGAFANRPKAWLSIELFGGKWRVDHRTAVGTIYGASIALWLFGAVAYALGAAVQGLSASAADSIAIAVAITATYVGSRRIKRQRDARERDMRSLAAEAVKVAVGRPISQAASDPKDIKICARLSGSTEDEIGARAKFYAKADTEQIKCYVPQGSPELAACQLVALLSDLPPLWIFDCYTNRRGSLPPS